MNSSPYFTLQDWYSFLSHTFYSVVYDNIYSNIALYTKLLDLSGFESETFHTLFILSNQIVAFSGFLAVEKKTLVTFFLFFQAHTAWFWFLLFV